MKMKTWFDFFFQSKFVVYLWPALAMALMYVFLWAVVATYIVYNRNASQTETA